LEVISKTFNLGFLLGFDYPGLRNEAKVEGSDEWKLGNHFDEVFHLVRTRNGVCTPQIK
jgi:hypothetical protein